jgi:hypothetical protein
LGNNISTPNEFAQIISGFSQQNAIVGGNKSHTRECWCCSAALRNVLINEKKRAMAAMVKFLINNRRPACGFDDLSEKRTQTYIVERDSHACFDF